MGQLSEEWINWPPFLNKVYHATSQTSEHWEPDSRVLTEEPCTNESTADTNTVNT